MARIELRNLNKTVRGEKTRASVVSTMLDVGSAGTTGPDRREPFALKNIDLTVPDGKTMVILGPSGCGKTTLLRVIAGLQTQDSGEVLYDGVDMAEVPAGARGIGMVFQDYALYPHLSTDDNVLSVFKFRRRTPELDAEAREKYERTSELMGVEITDLMGKVPTKLSGGEKQRVALARCITRDPTVFLMDEPFSNLDMQLRVKYRLNLKRLLQHFGITTVYVTHDQQEARILADLVAIMRDGEVVQIGTYRQLYEFPRSLFVAEFLNLDPATSAINLFKGEDIAGDLPGRVVGVRPENVAVVDESDALNGTVTMQIPNPLESRTILCVRFNDAEVQIPVDGNRVFRDGEEIHFRLERVHVFDQKTGVRLQTRQPTDPR